MKFGWWKRGGKKIRERKFKMAANLYPFSLSLSLSLFLIFKIPFYYCYLLLLPFFFVLFELNRYPPWRIQSQFRLIWTAIQMDWIELFMAVVDPPPERPEDGASVGHRHRNATQRAVASRVQLNFNSMDSTVCSSFFSPHVLLANN